MQDPRSDCQNFTSIKWTDDILEDISGPKNNVMNISISRQLKVRKRLTGESVPNQGHSWARELTEGLSPIKQYFTILPQDRRWE